MPSFTSQFASEAGRHPKVVLSSNNASHPESSSFCVKLQVLISAGDLPGILAWPNPLVLAEKTVVTQTTSSQNFRECVTILPFVENFVIEKLPFGVEAINRISIRLSVEESTAANIILHRVKNHYFRSDPRGSKALLRERFQIDTPHILRLEGQDIHPSNWRDWSRWPLPVARHDPAECASRGHRSIVCAIVGSSTRRIDHAVLGTAAW